MENDPEPGPFAPSLHDEVIHLAYAMTADPNRFASFQQLIISRVLAVYAQDDELLSRSPLPLVERYDVWRFHMNNALNLLEIQGRGAQKTLTLRERLDKAPEPGMLVDSKGVIVHANAVARKLFAVDVGQMLSPELFEASAFGDLEKSLANIRSDEPNEILRVVKMVAASDAERPQGADRTIHMAFVEEQLSDGHPIGRLSAAETLWTENDGRTFQAAFSLSEAEFEILRASVENLPLSDLANQKGRSLYTLRTQRWTLFKKLSVHSQVELTRLYCGFRQLDPTHSTGGNSVESTMIARPHGRQLEVRFFGPPKGKPILFFHAGLFGLRMTSAVIAELKKRDLRLICVCRPSFAGSSPASIQPSSPDDAAEDILAVLDNLKIDRCPAIALHSGSISAFALARRAPRRLSSLISVSGAAPLLTKSAIDRMSPLLKAVYLGARYMPEMVPFLTRARMAFTDAVPAKDFLSDHFFGSPGDLALLDDEELCSALEHSRNDAMRQGYRSFSEELILMANDWTSFLPSHALPVALIYGKEDCLHPPETVTAFRDRLRNASASFLKGTGRLAFYRHPDVVFDELARLEEWE